MLTAVIAAWLAFNVGVVLGAVWAGRPREPERAAPPPDRLVPRYPPLPYRALDPAEESGLRRLFAALRGDLPTIH